MPLFSQDHKLLSARHPDTEPPAGGADPDDGQVATWSAALRAWIAQDPTGGVTDHGALTGLYPDDDHTQYALADKSRPDPWITCADLNACSIEDLGTKDHDLLDGLLDDDHPQYALLAGRSGGQSLIGGLAASEHLTLQSTAHATRGYVRAQDDLQLLSNVLRDAAGANRLQLGAASPHLSLTGDAKISGRVGVYGDVSSAALLSVSPDSVDLTNQSLISAVPSACSVGTGTARAFYGAPVVSVISGKTATVHALDFSLGLGGGDGGAHANARNIYTGILLAYFAGTINEMVGYTQKSPAILGTPTGIALSRGIYLQNQGGSAYIIDVDSLKIADITGNIGHRYLIEAGPATPYFRVVGGADPAAGYLNVYAKVGGTLYQLRTRTINGYTALTID